MWRIPEMSRLPWVPWKVTAGADGVHCPGGIELSARDELLGRVRPMTGRVGGAEDGRGRGGGNIATGAGLGAAASFAEADVADDIAVAASGPQKN